MKIIWNGGGKNKLVQPFVNPLVKYGYYVNGEDRDGNNYTYVTYLDNGSWIEDIETSVNYHQNQKDLTSINLLIKNCEDRKKNLKYERFVGQSSLSNSTNEMTNITMCADEDGHHWMGKGADSGNNKINWTIKYTISTDTDIKMNSANETKYASYTHYFDSNVWVWGGYNGNNKLQMDKYTISSDSHTLKTNIPHDTWAGISNTYDGDFFYDIGNNGGNSTYWYSVSSDSYSNGVDRPNTIMDSATFFIDDLYVVGGREVSSPYHAKSYVEKYIKDTSTWESQTSLSRITSAAGGGVIEA